MNGKIAIFGTSGFAYEVADVAYSLGYKEIVLIGKDESSTNTNRLKIILEKNIDNLIKEGFNFAIGVGDPILRRKIYLNFKDLEYPNLIHPNSIYGIMQRDKFNNKKGNIITAGVIFTNNIEVGDFGVYNLNCTIGHDCIISDFVSLMPAVNVSGNVKLYPGVYVGVGAIILNGRDGMKLTINKNVIIGAGAVVTKDIRANVTVIGCPAREIVVK